MKENVRHLIIFPDPGTNCKDLVLVNCMQTAARPTRYEESYKGEYRSGNMAQDPKSYRCSLCDPIKYKRKVIRSHGDTIIIITVLINGYQTH